jgi:hypothetical protein
MPESLAGQKRRQPTARVAGFKSEPGRLHVGTPGRIKSESAADDRAARSTIVWAAPLRTAARQSPHVIFDRTVTHSNDRIISEALWLEDCICPRSCSEAKMPYRIPAKAKHEFES